MASDALFRQKAPGIMNLLMADFALDLESAAAILGNLGHESGGFNSMQEGKPLSGRGGYGWAQWTGPRRDQFEAYVQRNGFDINGDTANYKWLYLELTGSERAAIPAVKNAVGLEAKVKAFELAFERAHKDYKHYESRVEWANRALEAYRANPGGTLDVRDAPTAPKQPQEILPPLAKLDPSALAPLLNALAPFLLQLVAARTQQPGGAQAGQPDIAALLALLTGGQPIALPPPVVEPPKPEPAPVVVKSEPKTAVGVGLIGLLGSVLGMVGGQIGTPFGMGEAPTTAGTLSVVIPAAISMIGATGIFGPWGAVAGKLVGVLATSIASKAPK
jgi:hypothetical protein